MSSKKKLMRLKKLLTMNSTERKKYDVVIAGGGMIGIAMALSLSSFDLKIAVVEKIKRTNKEQPSFDDRSTALSRSSGIMQLICHQSLVALY